MSKNNTKISYECFRDFLKQNICDDGIGSELIDQLKRFYDDGVLILCGRDLIGKIRDIKGDDYLEIRYNDDDIICSYSKYNYRKKVSITQKRFNEVVRVIRKESTDCYNSEGYVETQNIEHEKVYNLDLKLLYESLLTDNSYCKCLTDGIKYDDKGTVFNKLCLNKKWFFKNGSVVYYKYCKDFFSGTSKSSETYSICIKPYMVNYVMVYDLKPLDETLFKKLMLQEITIEDAIKQINEEKVKKIGGNNV